MDISTEGGSNLQIDYGGQKTSAVLQRNGYFFTKDQGDQRIQMRAQLARPFGFNQSIHRKAKINLCYRI